MIKEPTWPDEKLEAEMLADGKCWDFDCHMKALLCRVRELERALRAVGYWQQVPFKTQDDRPDYFLRWKEAVEYTEGVDALMDGEVPTAKDGMTLWLADRVKLLLEKAKIRSSLAHRLWKRFYGDMRVSIGDGYGPELVPLYDDCLKELGEPK